MRDEAPDPRGAVPGGPRHAGIIMDGNGRWAKARMLPRIAGHRAGVEAVRRVVRAAPGLGMEALTLYAFSSENWRRPAEEVSDLMMLLKNYIESEISELDAQGVRLRLIGDWQRLRPDVVDRLGTALERTAANTRMNLVIALNYGSQDELVRAAAAAAAKGNVTAEAIEANLDTAGLPPLDLVVRTSGEYRLSNFLLWQAAYAELLFTPILWPDFGAESLREACEAFAQRERRFGGL